MVLSSFIAVVGTRALTYMLMGVRRAPQHVAQHKRRTVKITELRYAHNKAKLILTKRLHTVNEYTYA